MIRVDRILSLYTRKLLIHTVQKNCIHGPLMAKVRHMDKNDATQMVVCTAVLELTIHMADPNENSNPNTNHNHVHVP